MAGKVFLSCGQANPEEIETAKKLSQMLIDLGFSPYIAIQAQSIQDVNTAIISELKSSDFYIFVDFPRERLKGDKERARRGSLFTHQEMAIAYVLGFEKVLFLRHKDVKLEGLLRYTASNAIVFADYCEVVKITETAILERNWIANYTRHLMATNLNWSDGIIQFNSHTGESFIGKFLYIDINNLRPDLAAFNTVARLVSIIDVSDHVMLPSDRSHLKVTGQPGWSQTIWPQSSGGFDLLLVKADQGGNIFLNSALDVVPKPPIITKPGTYTLRYGVLSESFPILEFSIHLEVTGDAHTTNAQLKNS